MTSFPGMTAVGGFFSIFEAVSDAMPGPRGAEGPRRRTAVVTRSEAVAGPPPTPSTRRRCFGGAGGL